ncbi:MAG: hypothetical protein EBZ36_15630 [Acidobacteria bacterium]|nr:hypothetical protein [Acidobacteriota bacterium]
MLVILLMPGMWQQIWLRHSGLGSLEIQKAVPTLKSRRRIRASREPDETRLVRHFPAIATLLDQEGCY